MVCETSEFSPIFVVLARKRPEFGIKVARKFNMQSVFTHDSKKIVYKDSIGVVNGLWPLRCPQRNLNFLLQNPKCPLVCVCVSHLIIDIQKDLNI